MRVARCEVLRRCSLVMARYEMARFCLQARMRRSIVSSCNACTDDLVAVVLITKHTPDVLILVATQSTLHLSNRLIPPCVLYTYKRISCTSDIAILCTYRRYAVSNERCDAL